MNDGPVEDRPLEPDMVNPMEGWPQFPMEERAYFIRRETADALYQFHGGPFYFWIRGTDIKSVYHGDGKWYVQLSPDMKPDVYGHSKLSEIMVTDALERTGRNPETEFGYRDGEIAWPEYAITGPEKGETTEIDDLWRAAFGEAEDSQ